MEVPLHLGPNRPQDLRTAMTYITYCDTRDEIENAPPLGRPEEAALRALDDQAERFN